MLIIKTIFYLVLIKINGICYPVIAFDTREKAEQYIRDNNNEYVIDNIDVEYEAY